MKTTTRPLAPRRIPRRMVPRKTLYARAATSDEDFDDIDGEAEPSMKLSHAFIVVLLLHVLAVGGVFAFSSLRSKQILPDRSAKAAKGKPSQSATEAVEAPAKPAPAEVPIVTYTVVSGDTLKRIAIKHKTSIEALEKANDITSTTTLHVGQALRLPPVKISSAQAKPAATAAKPAATTKTQEPAASTKAPAAKDPVTSKVQEPKAAKPAEAKAESQEKAAVASDKEEKTYVVAQGDNPYAIAKKLKVSYNDLLKTNKIDDPKKLQIGQKLIIP